jgi:hypothetical protein
MLLCLPCCRRDYQVRMQRPTVASGCASTCTCTLLVAAIGCGAVARYRWCVRVKGIV